MEPNGKVPANDAQQKPPENKPLSLGQTADGIIMHILTISNGDLSVACSIGNLIKLRLETEYKFLIDQKLALASAALKNLPEKLPQA